MFIDQLIQRIIEKASPIVVGLDPQTYLIPQCIVKAYRGHERAMGEVIWQFNRAVIDAIKDLVPAVKLQIAFYEQWGLEGLEAYQRTIGYAVQNNLMVIGDIKRGDIFSTADAYAQVHLRGAFACHGVTINPFLGSDSIQPFLQACQDEGKGIFVLVKTSNPSSGEIQNLEVKGQPLYMHIAKLVEGLGRELVGDCGYSSVGAVVGATYPEEAQRLRYAMPHTFFLVPGYGAQGGGAEEISCFFDGRGLGAIVNSSRGILGAHIQEKSIDDSVEAFQRCTRNAVMIMQERILEAVRKTNKDEVYKD